MLSFFLHTSSRTVLQSFYDILFGLVVKIIFIHFTSKFIKKGVSFYASKFKVQELTFAHEKAGDDFSGKSSHMDRHNNAFGVAYLDRCLKQVSKRVVEFSAPLGTILYVKSNADIAYSFNDISQLKWIKRFGRMAYCSDNLNPVPIPSTTILREYGFEKIGDKIVISTANDEFFPISNNSLSGYYFSGDNDQPDIVTLNWGDGSIEKINMDVSKSCREWGYCPNFEKLDHIYQDAGQYKVSVSYRGAFVSEHIIDIAEVDYLNEFDINKDWVLNTGGGAQASLDISNGYATVDITNSGSETWDIEFVGPEYPLIYGEKYDLTFTASSDIETDITVGLQETTGSYISQSGYRVYTLGTAEKQYTYTFRAGMINSPSHIVMQLGKCVNAKIKIDDISVSIYKHNEPIFENFQTELLHDNTNLGVDWNLFLYDDAVAEVHTISGMTDIANNYSLPYAKDVELSDTSYLRVYISNSGTDFESIVLKRNGLFFEAGKKYGLSFLANSEYGDLKNMIVRIATSEKIGFDTKLLEEKVELSHDGWKKFTYSFTMPLVSDKYASIAFKVGYDKYISYAWGKSKITDVLLDHISVMEIK